MIEQGSTEPGERLRAALQNRTSSARLQAVLAAGTRPDVGFIDVLVGQCAVEPDFYVRDMLTWALTRHDTSQTVDRLLTELTSELPRARSQALHTLSKIGDPRAWSSITTALLEDENDDVARAAWRTAATLVPAGHEADLAERLSTQFGRGGRDLQSSLSRAFATLGDPALPVVERAKSAPSPGVRDHAAATERIMLDPDEGFDAALAEARRLDDMRRAGRNGLN